jgi:hypothetical protein
VRAALGILAIAPSPVEGGGSSKVLPRAFAPFEEKTDPRATARVAAIACIRVRGYRTDFVGRGAGRERERVSAGGEREEGAEADGGNGTPKERSHRGLAIVNPGHLAGNPCHGEAVVSDPSHEIVRWASTEAS